MSGDRLDLGNDHYATFTAWAPDRDLNPQYKDLPDVEHWGAIIEHPDKRDPSRLCTSGITFDGEVQRKMTPAAHLWTLVSLEPLHTEPSLLCICGDHGFIREGRWVPA